jgi:CheY-like chemotaxis protein
VPEQPTEPTPFADLLAQSRTAMAGLQALEEQLTAQLADQHAKWKQARTELDAVADELAALRTRHQQLTAEHARATAEAVALREQKAELHERIGQLHRDLDQKARDQVTLAATHEREREDLHARVRRAEAALAERVSLLEAQQQELDDLRDARLAWEAERVALVQRRDHESQRSQQLEAQQRQTAEELARAVDNREQLRKVYEELKGAHTAATERHAGAFREMSRLQEESNRLRDELAHVQADLESLQADQLKWAVSRQEMILARQTLEDHRLKLETELATTQLTLRETDVRGVEERKQLEAALADARGQVQGLSESAARASQAEAELKEQYSKLVDRAHHAAQEWSARSQALTEENHRLVKDVADARAALSSSHDSEREWQARLQQLELAQRHEKATWEEAMRTARELASRPLTPAESHQINTRLNAIVGFSNVLVDSGPTGVAPAEREEYLRLIAENARRLAEELHLVIAARGPQPAPAAPADQAPAVVAIGSRPAMPAILVADPDPAVRERLQPFLTRAGYDVVFAATGDEALAQARQLAPIAILVEANLPPGGAAALIGDLRRDPRTADIPVVVSTKNLDQPLGIDIGQVEVLTKPIDRQQLLQVMINHDLLADTRRARRLPGTILVIDDDPQALRLVRAVLQPLGIEVVAADGGRAGIELALRHRPELIICDLVMPDVDGFDVIAALRGNPETSRIPIMVYTGKSITAEDQQRLQGAIPSIITKGEFSKERFLELVLKRGERRSRGTTPPIAA